jgi:translation initiation factor IF-3
VCGRLSYARYRTSNRTEDLPLAYGAHDLRPRRGFDRPPEEPKTRINEAIRVPQVRLIDDDGSQIGLKSRDEALEYAWGKNLDLVEVAPDARPPVCRVMDYSKYKYEQEQKAKLARKHQSTITIKEIKLRPKVGDHDYETKKGHVVRFLNNRDKVKVTIMFRGREMTHPERGRSLLLRLAEDVKELAVIESEPLQDGRNMVMMLAPIKPREPQPIPTGRPPRDDAEAPVADAPAAADAPEADAAEAQAPAAEAPAADADAVEASAADTTPPPSDVTEPAGDVAAAPATTD